MGQFLDEGPRGKFLDADTTPAPSAWERVGSAVQAGASSLTPSGIAEQVKADFGPAVESIRNPKASTLLPLALPGGGSVVSRVGGLAAGRMIDEPSTDPMTNLATAGKGGAVGLAAEGFGGILGKILRSLPGAKGAIAAQDAARVGRTMGEASPGLAPGATVQDIRTAAVEAPRRLGAAKETAVQGVEQSLAAGQPANFIPPGHIPMPTLGRTMSLRDANAELSRIGDMIRGRQPLDPRYGQANLTQLYGQLARDIEQGVAQVGGPQAADAWRNLQAEYRAGRTTIKPFQTGAAYRPGATADEMQLNTPYLQRWLTNPKNEAALRSRLLPDQFAALEEALTRGGGAGSADVLAPGGRATDALMEILRGKGGATQIPALAPRTVLPNFGSSYAGRTTPYTFPAPLQAVLDAATNDPAVRAAERPLGR